MLTDSDSSACEPGAYGLSIRRPAFESSARHHSASAPAKPEEQVLGGKRPQRGDIVSFGPFRLVATERLIEMHGVPLNLGSRALDLLIALVERATEVVSKRELMARAWPNLVVDEGSLRFQIASLRKVLGDGQSGVRYVANVAGRGYCFVAPISRSAAEPPLAESTTLERSHNLLSEFERAVLRRLAVFVGSFSLEAARSVAAETAAERGQVAEVVASLVARSLVAAETGPKSVRCRLLDTTRTYALNRLFRSGEAAAVALRHATYYRELLELTDSTASRLSKRKGAAVHREHLSNVRAALEWSFSAHGDLDLGTALAAAAAPLFLEMSLPRECRVWMERSIAVRDAVPWDPRREMEIQAALALSLMSTEVDCAEVRSALLNAFALADELKYPSLQMCLRGALHDFLTRIGDADRIKNQSTNAPQRSSSLRASRREYDGRLLRQRRSFLPR
jgi:DNA-binding winged helix-turn-helix (wHTH) protein